MPCVSIEARKAHKGVTAIPKMVPGEPVTAIVAEKDTEVTGADTVDDEAQNSKRRRDEALAAEQDDVQAKRKRVGVPAA